MDGFPRTEEQAVALDGILTDLGIKLTGVVNIVVPDAELVGRVTGQTYLQGLRRYISCRIQSQ